MSGGKDEGSDHLYQMLLIGQIEPGLRINLRLNKVEGARYLDKSSFSVYLWVDSKARRAHINHVPLAPYLCIQMP